MKNQVDAVKYKFGENIREIIFGVEDGAIGNLGVVVGMIEGLAPTNLIILAGLATMFAQAISMGAGNYLSVKSEKEYFAVPRKERKYGIAYSKHKNPVISSLVMSISVIIGAAIPLAVFLFTDATVGVAPFISVTLAGLFFLGIVQSRYTLRNWLRSGVEILIIGAFAAL